LRIKTSESFAEDLAACRDQRLERERERELSEVFSQSKEVFSKAMAFGEITSKERSIMKLARRGRQERGTVSPWSQQGTFPFNELNRIRNEIYRIFEDPFSLAGAASTLFEGWTPAVDVHEEKDRITVRAELPGMKKEDIEVTVVGDTLTIAGERKQEEEKKEGQTYRSERYLGRFQRTITLPTEVDPNNIQATYKDGVLKITLGKSEQAKRKQIEIKPG